MSEFQQFLTASGAPMRPDGEAVASLPALQDGFVAPVTDQTLIAVNGTEAASFLNGQLTSDLLHLADTPAPGFGQARLAGYCTPKGRLLASLLAWHGKDTIWLQVPAELAAALQKRLQMFILRAKVKMTAVAGQPEYENLQVTLGLGGRAAGAALQRWFAALPPAPYLTVENETGTLIRLADAFGAPRYQWLCSMANAEAAWPLLRATLHAGDANGWQLAALHAGVPQIVLATQEQFVPQMINFELIGGVNFKKGCYPGQEIVARSQYLGTQKRRMRLASVAAGSVAPASEVFSELDPGQPCGMVVNAARVDDGAHSHCLVEIKTALAEGAVHLGSIDGPRLEWLAMPYALDAAA